MYKPGEDGVVWSRIQTLDVSDVQDVNQHLVSSPLHSRAKAVFSQKHGSHMDWKPWENEKTFFSQGILNKLEKSENFTENTGKMREFYPQYWKSEEILASFILFFFSYFLIEVYLMIDFCI